MSPATRDEILPPDRSCTPPSAFWFSRIARYAPSHCKAKFEAHLRPWLLTFLWDGVLALLKSFSPRKNINILLTM